MYYYRKGDRWFASLTLPSVEHADEDGVVAVGGDYEVSCFIDAYRRGIFPWPFGEGSDFLLPWCSPDPRFVLYPDAVHVSHSLRKVLKRSRFEVRADSQFESVIRHCASVCRREEGTWITEGMIEVFCALHRLGLAHSVESYLDGELVGGFYGMCLGRIFCGESMFTLVSDATKVAFVTFCRRASAYGIRLVDCQCYTENMARYGAHEMARSEFLAQLSRHRDEAVPVELWCGDWGRECGCGGED